MTLNRLNWRAWALPKRPKEIHHAVGLLGSLKNSGWMASAAGHAPVDGLGNPIPWYTLPAVAWLASRLDGGESVFEYGAGNSTLWYAKKCHKVTSVEHNQDWVQHLQPILPSNCSLTYKSLVDERLRDDYVKSVADAGEVFDVIVVDGQHRVECMREAPRSLARGGLIVVDDSNRTEYLPGIRYLERQDLLRLDFNGIEVRGPKIKCTSFFSSSFDRWLSRSSELINWPDAFEKRHWVA